MYLAAYPVDMVALSQLLLLKLYYDNHWWLVAIRRVGVHRLSYGIV